MKLHTCNRRSPIIRCHGSDCSVFRTVAGTVHRRASGLILAIHIHRSRRIGHRGITRRANANSGPRAIGNGNTMNGGTLYPYNDNGGCGHYYKGSVSWRGSSFWGGSSFLGGGRREVGGGGVYTCNAVCVINGPAPGLLFVVCCLLFVLFCLGEQPFNHLLLFVFGYIYVRLFLTTFG